MAQLPQLNTDLAEKGRWVPYPDAPEIEVLIARYGNRAARDMFTKLGVRKVRRASPEDYESINRQVMAHCIIRDWKGMTDEAGNDIPYTPEMALEILEDPRYAPFLEFVQVEAGMDDEYLQERTAAAAGN